MKLYGLTNKDIKQINEILSHYTQIEKAILYGSRAKGTFKNGSDIDLTLKGDQIDLALLSRLSSELDDTYLPYTFDISAYQQIGNSDLLDHIDRIGVVFYQR